MSGRPYAASARMLTPGRKVALLALEAAGERGVRGSLQHPTAMLAGLVSLGWAERRTIELGQIFVINPAGRDMLRKAKEGKAG